MPPRSGASQKLPPTVNEPAPTSRRTLPLAAARGDCLVHERTAIVALTAAAPQAPAATQSHARTSFFCESQALDAPLASREPRPTAPSCALPAARDAASPPPPKPTAPVTTQRVQWE